MGYRSAADGVAKKGKTKGMMLASGGKVKESMMEKKMGKNMARSKMQKVADKAVKGHESRMHKGAKKK